MRFTASLLALALLAAVPAVITLAPLPAAAQEADDADKKPLVPFREDSGLITAEYYLSTGKYAQALNVLAGVLKRHPESADAFTYTGYAYFKLGDSKKAASYYKKALIVNPTHLGANRYMAEIYLGQNNLYSAMQQMQVIRMTCGDVSCEELDELEAEINAYKNGQHEDAPAKGEPVKDPYN
ncbi:MAG: tetratricopeptide repeat protein [Micavibrio sp.]|nr:tetratricopeptide repeat protein [Micavibrio sp.]